MVYVYYWEFYTFIHTSFHFIVGLKKQKLLSALGFFLLFGKNRLQLGPKISKLTRLKFNLNFWPKANITTSLSATSFLIGVRGY